MASFDEDGVRETASSVQSDARRREKELASRDSYRSRQDALRAEFSAGILTMAEYAKQGREAGIAASEIGAALQERAAAEKRMEHKAAMAKTAADKIEQAGEPSDLATALAAKAQGLEALRQGESADAAEAFADAASLAERAAAATAGGSVASEALKVRCACLLNEALCRLKLEEWGAAESACTSALSIETRSAKAFFRRGSARLRLGAPVGALEDLYAATVLSPADKEIAKLLAEARTAAAGTTDVVVQARRHSSGASQASVAAGAAPSEASEAPLRPPEAAEASALAADRPEYVPATTGFQGFRAGYHFKLGGSGLGYYRDALAPTTLPVPPPALPSPPKLRVPDVAKRTHCFLAFSIGGVDAGRLTLQLFDDLVPRTVSNFRALLGGTPPADDGSLLSYSYVGSPLHRIAKGFIVQGGDVVAGDGSGCVSGLAGGEPFDDESFAIPHARPGVLSMANKGPNTNGCQFFLTFAAASDCDGKHVAFGRMVAGWALLRRIENLSVDAKDAPLEAVRISSCGELDAAEAARFHSGGGADADGVSGPLDMAGEALLKAASEADLVLMRELIGRGVPVDAYGCVTAPKLAIPIGAAILPPPGAADAADVADEEAETIECAALSVAARLGHLDMLRGLVHAGADVDLVDSSGRCALHWAVLGGHEECVEALLEANASLGARDGTGKVALHMAALHGQTECVRRLLGRYPRDEQAQAAREVDAAASGLSALHLAAGGDHAGCLSELLAAGAALDAKAVAELTPLHIAAGQGALMALTTLLAARADVSVAGERSGRTPLHTACEHGRPMAVAALLAAQSDVHRADSKGSQALHWACKANCHEAVACLLGARADPAALTRLGSSALHLACEAAAPKCAVLLLRAKVACDLSDGQGIRPLHAACAVGSVECLQLLLGQSADVSAPLHIEGNTSISENLGTESHTKAPLYLAAEKGHAQVVKVLLAARADVHALAVTVTEQTTTKTSALWAARRGEHDAVAELLVAAGATEEAQILEGRKEEGQVV